MLLPFKSESPRRIFVDELLISHTYGGLIEGRITPNINKEILGSLHQHAVRLWKRGPSLILEQDKHLANLSRDLPTYSFTAHCISAPPIHDRNKDASHLVLIWLASNIDPVFSTNVINQIKTTYWDRYAEDLNYDV